MRSALLLTSAFWALASPAPPAQEFSWREDLERARKDAAREGKPLLVVFR